MAILGLFEELHTLDRELQLEELVANLSAIASHGLQVVIIPPEEAGFTVLKRLPGTY